MNYLESSEYESYGLESTTLTSWIAAASALMDAHCRRSTLGVTQYTERIRMSGRHRVRLSYLPLATIAPATSPVVVARGRYGAVRKGEGIDLLSELAQVFALPGTWSTLDVNSIDYDAQMGELTLPLLPLALPYDEVEITYNAGFATIPESIKQACAQIVKNAQATPALNVKRQRISQAELEYFAPSLIDDSVRQLLSPYMAQKVA